ncbi:MAG: RloB domain-containing protein [Spirochaetales bacterium]|nr:RloB domain-containing protein [Spirochaetales bacterium]
MARNKAFKLERKTILVVVEGETERTYFKQMRVHNRLPNISIEPKLSSRRDPVGIIETAIREKKNGDFDHIWCVFDVDTIDKYPSKYDVVLKRAKRHNISIADSLPCFEVWFLLHFQFSTRQYPGCEQVVEKLRHYLTDYRKNTEYFRKKNLFKYLYIKLPDAIKNAKMLDDENSRNDVMNGTKSDIYRIFEVIEKLKR